MIEIKQINFFDYMLFYLEKFPISLRFINQKISSCREGGIILLAVDNNSPLGMAFGGLDSSEIFSIDHISIGSEMNCDEVENCLFESCVSVAQKKGAKIVKYHRIIQTQKSTPFCLKDTSKKIEPINHVFSYSLSMSQNNLRQLRDFWITRGKKILHRLNQRGYALRPMSKVDKEVAENLYLQIENGFNGGFDPKACGVISTRYNSVVLWNNNSVAVCIVSLDTLKSEIVIEQLFVKKEYRKKGVFLLLLFHVFTMCINEKIKYISYQINVGNNTMLNVQNNSLNFLECIKTDYCVYRYVLPQNKY